MYQVSAWWKYTFTSFGQKCEVCEKNKKKNKEIISEFWSFVSRDWLARFASNLVSSVSSSGVSQQQIWLNSGERSQSYIHVGVKIVFLSIYSQCGAMASWAATTHYCVSWYVQLLYVILHCNHMHAYTETHNISKVDTFPSLEYTEALGRNVARFSLNFNSRSTLRLLCNRSKLHNSELKNKFWQMYTEFKDSATKSHIDQWCNISSCLEISLHIH